MPLKKDLEAITRSGGPYFGYLDITHYPCPPFVMFVNNTDDWVAAHFIGGTPYEPQTLKLWCALARTASSVVNVGAHTGLFSLTAAGVRPEIPIIAFEPNPDAYARLVVNATANGFKNIVAKRHAVADKKGHTTIGWVVGRSDVLSPGGRLGGYNDVGSEKLVVQADTLNNLLNGIDLGSRPLVKIDVEGVETLIFLGIANVLARLPDIILETFDAEACQFIVEMTARLGYRYYLIDEESGAVVQRDRLMPAGKKSLNQLLSVRPVSEIAGLMA